MNTTIRVRFAALLSVAALLALAGCGGGGTGSGPSGSYAVGGTVSGLPANATVSLLNNGGDSVAIGANGTFKFANDVAAGGAYAVTVQSHTPGVGCDISNGSGTVGGAAVTTVAVTCRAGAASALYVFDGSPGSTDGQNPAGGLVMDGAGNFYGTTQGGGVNGQGAIFKISPAGTKTVIYSFVGGVDGSNPQSGLTIDSAGNLYGTTYSDGATSASCTTGCGTVFKVTTAGTGYTVLHSFGSTPNDGRNPQASLILDGAGNLYGTTYYGGTVGVPCASGCGTVFKLTTQGTSYNVLYRFAGGAADGQNPQASLVWDGAGNLYGTTSSGGIVDTLGTVFKLTTTGFGYAVMHSFNGSDGQTPLAGLVLDGAGNLWGTTSAGGANTFGTVFKIAASDSSFSLIYSFDVSDGQYPEANLIKDSAGNFYGVAKNGGSSACTNGCGTVFKITSAGVFSVLYSFGVNDGQNPTAALVLDSIGNLYGTTTVGPTTLLDPVGVGVVFKID